PTTAIVVTPKQIAKVRTSEVTVYSKMKNDGNATVNVTVTSTDPINISVRLTHLTLKPNETVTIPITLRPVSVQGAIVYSTDGKVIVQKVKIENGNLFTIVVYPKIADITVTGNNTTVKTLVFNPTDRSVRVRVSGAQYINPSGFTLKPREEKTVTLKLVLGSHIIRYDYDFGFKKGEILQTITVKKVKVENVEKLKREIEKLRSEINLPDRIRVSVEGGRVGKPVRVTVQGFENGRWVTLDRVLVSFDGVTKFTDSQGCVYFTPHRSGLIEVKVYDRFGNVKAVKYVNVSKCRVGLDLPDTTVGHSITITLPEKGNITVYKDGAKVFSGRGNRTFTFTPKEPGRYVVKFSTPSYYGAGSFVAKAFVVITAEVNGKTVPNGGVIPAGSVVTLKFEYNDGKPVKSAVVTVGIPINFFTSSGQKIVFIPAGGGFLPPFNIKMTETVTNGVLTLTVPKGASGVITVSFPSGDYVTGSTAVFRVKSEAIIPPYIYAVPIAVAIGVVLVVMYLRNVWGFADKLKSLKRLKNEEDVLA
ncbi:MAG: motile sperm domain-containing protein, partial [Sulfurovum sp.]|nr:motile sperm domain-containing protein [Sulfurovum sp.]